MKAGVRALLTAALILSGVVDFVIYRNSFLFSRAQEISGPEKKVEMLRKANKSFPWNDRAYYELGKAYFELGMQRLNTGRDASVSIEEAIRNLERSIRINPASPFGHFYYAQALQFADLLAQTQSSSDGFSREFHNAAKLAGENREILYEAGKRLLAHWRDLEEEDREFALEILHTALQWKPVEKFPTLLNLWQLNVGEVDVLERIMPDDPRVYRMFGAFLGKKSMSLKDRHRILSRADYMEFEIGKSLLASGYRELDRSNFEKAEEFFRWCLGNRPKIRSFHKISGQYPLADSELHQLYKSANLGMARTILESGAGFDNAREYLSNYLEMENDEIPLREFESILTKNKIADTDLRLLLYQKQRRYQDIVDSAGVDPVDKGFSGKSLYIIGDAFRELGMHRDAALCFERSIENDSKDLRTLLAIRQFYRNTNKYDIIYRINGIIKNLITPTEMNFSDYVIKQDKLYDWGLAFEGQVIDMNLRFLRMSGDRAPLVTLEFNQEVVWDDHIEEGEISFSVKTVAGENILHITAVNCPVILKEITYSSR
jgi:tetratricopeptide (TPR) repeat protein